MGEGPNTTVTMQVKSLSEMSEQVESVWQRH